MRQQSDPHIQKRIGIVAPAEPISVISDSNIEVGLENLANEGFLVSMAPHINYGLSGSESARVRAEDINHFFMDDGIDVILAAIGGYSSLELVPYLDYEMISRNPKPFIGFSDNTAVLLALLQKAHIETFYGPNFATFCQRNLPEYTKKYFSAMVRENLPMCIESVAYYADDLWYLENTGSRKWKENGGLKIKNRAPFQGRIIGGNLETFLSLAGTDFFPNDFLTGSVLILEEARGKNFQAVRRELQQLKLMGALNRINAILFGRFWGWNQDQQDLFMHEVFDGILKDFTRPVMYNLDFGHTDPMMTLPIGGWLEYDGQRITFRKCPDFVKCKEGRL